MSVNSDKTVTLTKDGGMVVAPTQSQDSGEGGSIRIPQADTSLGADFGDPICDADRQFAADREPVAGFLIYGIAADIVEKWFSINDLETKEPDPELDRSIQSELRVLKYKRELKKLVEYERLYGKALLVGAFADAANVASLAVEKPEGAELKQLVAYAKIAYNVASKDEDPTSLRYDLPVSYQVNNGLQSFAVHWTRCFELQTRTNGLSILDLIWDDLTCGRNIRWGVSQWIYRTGGGFAVIKFPKEIAGVATTPAKLREWAAAKEWSDITHRTYICILNEIMDFKFEGAQGAEPFFDTNTKQIAKATGIPKSILEGAEAGALTGSEKNDQQYYKKISGYQSELEDVNRWVIDQILTQINGVTVQTDSAKSAGSVLKRMLHRVVPAIVKDQAAQQIDYEIVWNNAFELNAVDKARTALLDEQANQTRLQYKTIDEVRADNELLALPMGEGEVVLSLKAPVNPFPNNQPQNSAQNTGSNQQQGLDAALPTMRALIQPIIKQVFDGYMTHDVAVQQGTALIGFYCGTEKERALEYVRGKFQNPTLGISPEQERAFAEQKDRFTKDFMEILGKAEKLVKAKQP
jgi:hypothetical protein